MKYIYYYLLQARIPDPLLYVDGSIKATLGGRDLFNYDTTKYWYGYSATDDKNVEVEVLSPVVDGTEGPSNIPPEEAWGKEVIVKIKCEIDPDEDLSEYTDPVVNIAEVEVDGKVLSATDDNKASVLGIYELADDDGDDDEDEESVKSAKRANTGDDTPIGLALIALFGSGAVLEAMRRRRRTN